MIPLKRMTRGVRVTFGVNGAEGEMAVGVRGEGSDYCCEGLLGLEGA